MPMKTIRRLIIKQPNLFMLLAGICTSSLAYAAGENESVITVYGEGNTAEEAIGSNGTYAAKQSVTATKTSTPLIKTPSLFPLLRKKNYKPNAQPPLKMRSTIRRV